MDVETTTAIERLSERLNERIDKLEMSVRGDIASLRADMNEGPAEGRRHTKVLIEETNETLKIVAEGVAHLSVKVDSLIR